MSTSPKPTIVIAHGAWQPVSDFTLFAQSLVSLGHAVEVVALPSIDHDSIPTPGLREDCSAVASTLSRRADAGEEIILLCHSYGGLVGSCAVEGQDVVYRKTKLGKRGGVVLVLYLSAFMLPKGKNMMEMLGGEPLDWWRIEDDKVFITPEKAHETALNDMTKEQAAPHINALRHASFAAFNTPATYEPWANGIPCSYVFTELDGALPLPIQQAMASQIGPDAVNYSLKSAHCPFLSMPEQMLDVIAKAAESLGEKEAVVEVKGERAVERKEVGV